MNAFQDIFKMADPSNLQSKILLLFKKEKKLILDFGQVMSFGDEFRFRRPKGYSLDRSKPLRRQVDQH